MSESLSSVALPIGRSGTRRCATQHFGAWSIEPRWFQSALNAVRAGTFKPAEPKADWDDDDDDDVASDNPGYALQDGVAIISIDGQMTKRGSSFGGCSTVAVRQAVRDAAADYGVKAIVMHICSPGGTVAGTADLAQDVADAAAIKPVDAYIADMGCSAAYWIASQCRTIYANTTALVGSIGTYALLEDDTGYQEKWGVKCTVVSTGDYKGLGADGTVSDKLIADVQREVNELNASFLAAVAAGRGDKIADMAAVTDGRVHVSAQALKLGLIDQVASLDVAMSAMSDEVNPMTTPAMTADAFKNYAAANPEDPTVKELVGRGQAAGKAEGKAAEQARAKEIAGACGDNHQLAVKAIIEGHDPAAVKLAADSVADAKKSIDAQAQAHTKALAEKEAELKAMRDQFHQGTQPPVATRGETAPAATAPNDATAIAAKGKAEWAANKGGCRDNFLDEATYIDTLKAEAKVK